MLLTKNVGISPFSAENYNSLLSTLLLYNNNNQIVKFILKLDLRKSNIKTNILHSNGKTIFKDSSGILGFKSSNKHKKIAFNSIIKKLKFKMKNFRYFNFSLHFLGSKFSKKFITKKLNKFINLKIIKTYNLMPFNGCRPLKKKRKKFKKKLILI
jgi:ribosomal protein S11